MSAVLRWSLAGLGIALLAVLGLLGEEARNLANLAMPAKCGTTAPMLPAPTQLAFDLYGLNTGYFFLSLTPLMIVLGAIAACARAATPAMGWIVLAIDALLVVAAVMVFRRARR